MTDISHNQIIGCEGKVAFRDRGIAIKAAGRRSARDVYLCKFCGAFHVGTVAGKDGNGGSKRKRNWRR